MPDEITRQQAVDFIPQIKKWVRNYFKNWDPIKYHPSISEIGDFVDLTNVRGVEVSLSEGGVIEENSSDYYVYEAQVSCQATTSEQISPDLYRMLMDRNHLEYSEGHVKSGKICISGPYFVKIERFAELKPEHLMPDRYEPYGEWKNSQLSSPKNC